MNTPIDISEEAGVRYLHFGSEWVQGAMRIRRPYSLELEYTREMLCGLLLHAEPWPRHVLLIGLGAGSLARFLHRHYPETRITVVEIAPGVVHAARQFFRLPDEDRRFRIVIGDGAEFVEQSRSRFDCILVDGFDRFARVGALDTLPFYLAARARLSRDGLLAANLFSGRRGFKASVERLSSAFDGRCLALPPSEGGNVIGVAADGRPINVSLGTLRERAVALKARTGLDLRPTITRLQLQVALPEGKLAL